MTKTEAIPWIILLAFVTIIAGWIAWGESHKQKVIVKETAAENANARYEANEADYKARITELERERDSIKRIEPIKEKAHEKRKEAIRSLPYDSGLVELLRTTDREGARRYGIN